MSLRSILMEIVITSVNKPLFIMIAGSCDRESEGIIPVGR